MLLDLLESSWRSLSSNEKPVVLCLGLGSPSSSRIARVQLAFLTETCQLLKVVCAVSIPTFFFCHRDFTTKFSWDQFLFFFYFSFFFFLSGFLIVDVVTRIMMDCFLCFFILNRTIKMCLFMTLFLRRKIIYFSKRSSI